jgi:sugar O-acyltransferase (sialic acid O-acetyltransferase NeuD family)
MKPLVILGAGGLGAEALWVARDVGEWDPVSFADDDVTKGGHSRGIPITGKIEAVYESMEPTWFYCAIGDNLARGRVFDRFMAKGWKPAKLVHPSVIMGPGVEIGDGCYVGAGSILGPDSSLGRGVVINCHVTVGHDSRMEEFTQACPGSRISGHCRVGAFAFLGSNATLRQGVRLGSGTTVAANSLVVRNVAEGMVIGVPARSMSLLS